MSSLQEAIFERLYPKYRQIFGEPPPFQAATVDEAVAYMRSRLRAQSNRAARDIGARRITDLEQRGNDSTGAQAAA